MKLTRLSPFDPETHMYPQIFPDMPREAQIPPNIISKTQTFMIELLEFSKQVSGSGQKFKNRC